MIEIVVDFSSELFPLIGNLFEIQQRDQQIIQMVHTQRGFLIIVFGYK